MTAGTLRKLRPAEICSHRGACGKYWTPIARMLAANFCPGDPIAEPGRFVPMTDKPSTYCVRSTAPHWFVIDIVKPDGSKHLVGGFPTQEAALEWIKTRDRKSAPAIG